MKTYKHIFFDLDHTLWDFDKNAEATLRILLKRFNLEQILPFDVFHEVFKKVTFELWEIHNRHEITKEGIRALRFPKILEHFDINDSALAKSLELDYRDTCPKSGRLMPYARETLTQLSSRGFVMHILTNGFEETQHTKLLYSGIADYFREVITSESTGYTKPHPKIFEFAFEKTGADPEESVLIGDNPETDIAGAKLAGMDSIFYKYGSDKTSAARYEVNCLSDIPSILSVAGK